MWKPRIETWWVDWPDSCNDVRYVYAMPAMRYLASAAILRSLCVPPPPIKHFFLINPFLIRKGNGHLAKTTLVRQLHTYGAPTGKYCRLQHPPPMANSSPFSVHICNRKCLSLVICPREKQKNKKIKNKKNIKKSFFLHVRPIEGRPSSLSLHPHPYPAISHHHPTSLVNEKDFSHNRNGG